MPDLDPLVAFLRARYDERAAKAEAAQPGPWLNADGTVRAADGAEIVDWTSSAEHIAANDPKSVLDDIATKRQIMEAHESLWRPGAAPEHIGPACKTCSSEVEGWPCTTLRLLALPFAGHPDYSEDFRP